MGHQAAPALAEAPAEPGGGAHAAPSMLSRSRASQEATVRRSGTGLPGAAGSMPTRLRSQSSAAASWLRRSRSVRTAPASEAATFSEREVPITSSIQAVSSRFASRTGATILECRRNLAARCLRQGRREAQCGGADLFRIGALGWRRERMEGLQEPDRRQRQADVLASDVGRVERDAETAAEIAHDAVLGHPRRIEEPILGPDAERPARDLEFFEFLTVGGIEWSNILRQHAALLQALLEDALHEALGFAHVADEPDIMAGSLQLFDHAEKGVLCEEGKVLGRDDQVRGPGLRDLPAETAIHLPQEVGAWVFLAEPNNVIRLSASRRDVSVAAPVALDAEGVLQGGACSLLHAEMQEDRHSWPSFDIVPDLPRRGVTIKSSCSRSCFCLCEVRGFSEKLGKLALASIKWVLV